ncbi:MAG: hypothetical protein H6757_02905 [Candidatus Omnitrophica bacterium]|nr:hypothetical protein [Candidatus Omnitrophota bacterium]
MVIASTLGLKGQMNLTIREIFLQDIIRKDIRHASRHNAIYHDAKEALIASAVDQTLLYLLEVACHFDSVRKTQIILEMRELMFAALEEFIISIFDPETIVDRVFIQEAQKAVEMQMKDEMEAAVIRILDEQMILSDQEAMEDEARLETEIQEKQTTIDATAA